MERRARRPDPEPSLFDDGAPLPVPDRPLARTPDPTLLAPTRLAPAPARTEDAAPLPPPAAATQPPLYTVTQLSALILGRLQELGRVRIEGEVAQRKCTASGHVYFDLKDAGAKLACKVWQSQVQRVVRFDLADGAQVVAWGRLDLYAPQGGYSLIVDRLEPLGLGALLAQLEQRKRELKERGWFDRKRALPDFPRTIGLVTSRDGAALRDFLRTRSLRWPGYPVRLAHTAVQGPGAAESIAGALRALAASGVDALVLVRGGGSLEDLWAFNELAVAEAIWSSGVPVVTGIGHQTDTTLADLVADHRAHTPTDAAQTLIPDRAELCARFARAGNYLGEAFGRLFEERAQRYAALAARPVLRDAGWILGERTRTLVALHARLDGALRGDLAQRASKIARCHAGLARRTPAAELARRTQRLATAQVKLGGAVERALERRAHALALKARSLEAISPLAVLGRGYSITRRVGGTRTVGGEPDAGSALTDARTLAPGAEVETRLARGSFRARVEFVRPPEDGA